MKAVGYYQAGAIDRPDALLDLEAPVPQPGPRDLLVRVRAVSVNPVDCKVRRSNQPPDGAAKVIGYDAAGTVEAVGSEVQAFKPGDPVYYAGDISRPGTNAEFHLVDERIVGHKPQSLTWGEAAAVPLTAITAWELLFERMRVPCGRKQASGTLLILNGAGGVGSMLIQLARRLTGLTVVATASREESATWCRKLGAHQVIDHHRPLGEQLQALGMTEVDYVAGLTATEDYLGQIVEIIKPQGVFAPIVNSGSLDVAGFMTKSVTIAWELMFTRPLHKTDDMIEQQRLLNEIAAMIDAGLIETTMTAHAGVINAANLIQAHIQQESGTSVGKTVLVGF